MERQAKKDKAIELMKQLDIYQPYIDGFKEQDKVCLYEKYAGFWVEQDPEVENKMKELEAEYKCVVYAITHEIANIGEVYNFLIVPHHKSDWGYLLDKLSKNEYIAFAYVWNKSYEYDSEFGSIVVKAFGGGIRRMG